MEDATTLLKELREVSQEGRDLEEQISLLDKRREALKERRALLENTWRVMQSNDVMTLIQAKMIAHENHGKKGRNQFFMWYGDFRESEVPQSWWTRILRSLYVGLGGR